MAVKTVKYSWSVENQLKITEDGHTSLVELVHGKTSIQPDRLQPNLQL